MVAEFDFHIEAAEIQPDTVISMQVEVLSPARQARVILVTLENQAFELDWTIQNGLRVDKVDGETATGKWIKHNYEDLNQFLQSNSQKYQQKFNESLMHKLLGLQGIDPSRFVQDEEKDDE